MNKRLWILPVLAAILVASSGVGYAIPSLGGPTGVVMMPNALVAPMGNLQVAGSYQTMSGSGTVAEAGATASTEALVSALEPYILPETAVSQFPYGTGDEFDDFSVWSLQALAGVAEGAELWAAFSQDNSDFDVTTWAIGGKYVIPTQTASGTSFAIGAGYRSGSGDADLLVNLGTALPDPVLVAYDLDANATDVYGVVTQDFSSLAGSEWCPGSKLLGSLGVLWKSVDAEVTASTFVDPDTFIGAASLDESLLRPFAALQWISADNVYLGLEYRWEDSDLDADPVFSAVLGAQLAEGWTGEVGTTNADQLGLGLDDQNWFARVGYTFAMGGAW